MVETANSALIREVSPSQSVLYREVPLYIHTYTLYLDDGQDPFPVGSLQLVEDHSLGEVDQRFQTVKVNLHKDMQLQCICHMYV